MKFRAFLAAVVALLSASLFAQGPPDARSLQEAAILNLQREVPGVKVYRLGARVSRIWGVPFATGTDPIQAANDFVESYADIFGLGVSSLHLRRSTDLMNGKFTAVEYSQSVGDKRVENGSLVLLVLNRTNEVVLASNNVRTIERNPGSARISSKQAIRYAQLDSPWALQFSDPQLVVWEGETTDHVAWSLLADNGLLTTPAVYRVYVDARTGAVLEWKNLVREINVIGNVKGWATPGLKPDQPNNPPQLFNLGDLRVNITGGNFAYTNPNGDFTISHGGTTQVTVNAELKGQWVTVVNAAGSNLVLSQNVTPPGPANFIFNSAPTEFNTAQVNAFIQTERVHDFADGINPAYPGIDIPLPANVNLNNTCNAFYNGSSINFYRAGGGCGNTAYSSVIWHEYGHFIIDRGHPSAAGDYHEGMADVTAALLGDSPCLGEDFLGQGSGCLRNAYNSVVYPCSGEVHLCGQVISGAFWLTLDELNLTEGHTVGMNLVRSWYLNSILLRPTGITPEVTIDVLTLDDNDANIYNGTPHYTEIANGFGAKRLYAPNLDWVNFEAVRLAPEFIQLPSFSARVPVAVRVTNNAGTLNPASVRLHYRVNSGAWQESMMLQISPNNFAGSFAVPECGSDVLYYFTAQDTAGHLMSFPRSGSADPFFTVAGTSITTALEDPFSADLGWTVTNVNLSTGAWTRADPNGTTQNGQPANPENDSTDSGTFCYFTEQGPVGGGVGDHDVDGGPTYLTSPTFNLAGANAIIEYRRWFWNDDGDDTFRVEVSNDGGATWVVVENTPFSPGMNAWIQRKFVVSAFVTPTANVKVRFSTADQPNNSITEAAVDYIVVRKVNCG